MTGNPPAADVAAELRRAGVGEVSASSLRRALYASDASLYRVVPAVGRERARGSRAWVSAASIFPNT